ncbi:MAG: hypothetical protein WCG25_06605 [bacterium]
MLKQPINRKTFEIETERLLLVPIALEYSKDIFKEFDEEITKYMFPIPAEEIAETMEFINHSIEKNLA